MIINLLIAVGLVLANGFFVAAEFALTRLRPTQVSQFERDRRPGARSVRHAVDHLDAYLAACQLGITIASLGLGVVGEPAFEKLLSTVLGHEAEIGGVALGAVVAFVLMTLLHVVLGELAPKSVAISRTTHIVLALAPLLRLFYLTTKPLVDLFNGMGNALLRPFGIPPAQRRRTDSPQRERVARAAR
jgi:CBS domain containing-hemolysin-like protein